jgi:hypothetical protein
VSTVLGVVVIGGYCPTYAYKAFIILSSWQPTSQYIQRILRMQGHDDLEPTVHIRELKKDRVNFVLKNVDLAYGKPF